MTTNGSNFKASAVQNVEKVMLQSSLLSNHLLNLVRCEVTKTFAIQRSRPVQRVSRLRVYWKAATRKGLTELKPG